MRYWRYCQAMPDSIFHEETHDPVYADQRNFYKVERWSRDWMRVELMLYAGNDLDKARRMFDQTVRARPRIRLTIRQRTRVLEEWPLRSG